MDDVITPLTVPTTNYGWLKPDVGGSADVWGNQLNTVIDQIDAQVRSGQTSAQNDNRIINGDMRIDQRNNGASGTAIGVYTVDRWRYGASQAAKGTWQRVAASPQVVALGFGYILTFTSSSAFASAATDNFMFEHRIEADMISDFAFGTAGAQSVTLSFLANSNQTGTFSGALCNDTGARSYPFSFSLPTANTWTKIALTIPGDTAGTWVMSGNAASMLLRFDLGSGANFRGAANAWAAANYTGATGAVSVVGTNGAQISITGVKLEIGPVATPFNRQSLAKSQADCERYFRWVPFHMRFVATAASLGFPFTSGASFPAMRAAPTISAVLGDPNLTAITANYSSATFNYITPYGAAANLVPTAAGDCYVLGCRASATAEL